MKLYFESFKKETIKEICGHSDRGRCKSTGVWGNRGTETSLLDRFQLIFLGDLGAEGCCICTLGAEAGWKG